MAGNLDMNRRPPLGPEALQVQPADRGPERTAYFDGAASGNPGPAGYAWVLVEAGVELEAGSQPVALATNNEMEWRGALAAVTAAIRHGWRRFRLVGDSQLVCRQITGEYKVREDGLQQLKAQMDELLKGLEIQVAWVPREQNPRANELAQTAAKSAESLAAAHQEDREMTPQEEQIQLQLDLDVLEDEVHGQEQQDDDVDELQQVPAGEGDDVADDDNPTADGGHSSLRKEVHLMGSDTGVYEAGMAFVITGPMASAVLDGKPFRVHATGIAGARFDPALVRVIVRTELAGGPCVIVEARRSTAEYVVLSYLSATNAARAQLLGHIRAVDAASAAKRAVLMLADAARLVRREDLRQADAPMIGALGTVHAQIRNRRSSGGVVEIAVGERLLAALAKAAGIRGTMRRRAVAVAKAITEHGVLSAVFRNPVTEVTAAAVQVRVVVAPGSGAIHLPPDLAKRFYGDFDGDLYFLVVALTALREAKEVQVNHMDIRRYLRPNRLSGRCLEPDSRVRLENVGTADLPVSVFNGILPLIGAEVRSVTGAYHAMTVSAMDQVRRRLGAEAATRVGDLLLPLIEVIMDAGKETSKVDRVKHGLPFAQHLVSMLSITELDDLAEALKTLADKVGEYFGNHDCAEALAIREAAGIVAEAASVPTSEGPGMMEALEGSAYRNTLPDPEDVAPVVLGLRYEMSIRELAAPAAAPAPFQVDKRSIGAATKAALDAKLPDLPTEWDMPPSLNKAVSVLEPVTLTTVDRLGVVRAVELPGVKELTSAWRVAYDGLHEASSPEMRRSIGPRKTTDGIVRLQFRAMPNHGAPVEGTPAFYVVLQRSAGGAYHRFLVVAPVIHDEPVLDARTGELVRRSRHTAYRPIAVSAPFQILKRIGDLVTAIRVTFDGTTNVITGRFTLGLVGEEHGIVFQPAPVVLLDTMLQAIYASNVGMSVRRGPKVQSIWAQTLPAVQRAVDRAISALLDSDAAGADDAGVSYLSHMLAVDPLTLNAIRQPLMATVSGWDAKGNRVTRKTELPKPDSVSYLAIGDRIEQVIDSDGNARRIYLPLKKDGSRVLWFDPSDERELAEMGIAVADTNFRRAVREQLPLEAVEVVSPVNGRHVELVVAFANGDALTSSKGESVEGGFLATDVVIRVTRTFQVEVDPSLGTIGEQLYRAMRMDGIHPTHVLTADGWKPFNAAEFRAADEEALERAGVRVRDEELIAGVTLRRASVKVGIEGTPDACKVMLLDGSIKGVVSRLYRQRLEAELGGMGRVPVDMVLPASTIVEKKTGSVVFYGLCRLFGYADLIERYDEELRRQRAARNQRLADGDPGQMEDMALLARFRDALIARIREEHGGVDVNAVPIVAKTMDRNGNVVREEVVGSAMVVRLRAAFLPHTSATIGRFGRFGSQMLLRAALRYRAEAGDAVAGALLPSFCATRMDGRPDVAYANRLASQVKSILTLMEVLSDGGYQAQGSSDEEEDIWSDD